MFTVKTHTYKHTPLHTQIVVLNIVIGSLSTILIGTIYQIISASITYTNKN